MTAYYPSLNIAMSMDWFRENIDRTFSRFSHEIWAFHVCFSPYISQSIDYGKSENPQSLDFFL